VPPMRPAFATPVPIAPRPCQIHAYTRTRGTNVLSGGDHVANRRNTTARATRGTNEDRQLSFVVREPEAALPNDPLKLALHIPPPRDPVSAIRRLDLASRWAMDLGELAAELVSEGKLDVEQTRSTPRAKERTR